MIKLEACTDMWQATHPDTIFLFQLAVLPNLARGHILVEVQQGGRGGVSLYYNILNVDDSTQSNVTPH